MRSIGVAAILIAAMHCRMAFATLVSEEVVQPAERVAAFGQVEVGTQSWFWARAALGAEGPRLTMQPFAGGSARDARTHAMEALPILIAPVHRLSGKGETVLAYSGSNGEQRVARLDSRSGRFDTGSVVEGLQLSVEVLGNDSGFAIAGVGADDAAAVVFLDRALRPLRLVRLPVDKGGEASALLAFHGNLIVLTNHEDGQGYMHVLGRTGEVRSTQRLAGGAATGVVVEKGDGVVVTYRVGKEILVERFDRALKSVWTRKLHEIERGSTRKARMLEVPGGLAWVGAANGRLVVYRLDREGRVLERSVDEVSGYGLPAGGMYGAVAVGSSIHVRGQASRAGSGVMELFHFVDRPR